MTLFLESEGDPPKITQSLIWLVIAAVITMGIYTVSLGVYPCTHLHPEMSTITKRGL